MAYLAQYRAAFARSRCASAGKSADGWPVGMAKRRPFPCSSSPDGPQRAYWFVPHHVLQWGGGVGGGRGGGWAVGSLLTLPVLWFVLPAFLNPVAAVHGLGWVEF